MQRSTLALGAVVLLAAVLIIYDRPEPAPPAAAGAVSGAALPEGHPALDGAAPATAGATSGPIATVLETMSSGGYTYARVETVDENGEAAEIWAAGPVTPLEVGQEVSLEGAMGMQNFRAASLDRTFDAILFVNRFGTGAVSAGSAAPAPGAVPPAGSFTDEEAPIREGTVLEVIHGAGYSYVHVENDGVDLWVAGLQLDVEEGQAVTWDGGAVMRDFESPTLERTFDRLLFADGLRIRE